MKPAIRTTIAVSFCGGLCLLAAVTGIALTSRFKQSQYDVTYADFISILLTAISVMMMLLAFIISIMAVIGWNSIGAKVASDVKDYLNEGFKDGNSLHQMVRREIQAEKDRVMFEGTSPVDDKFEEDAAAQDADDANG